MLLAQEPHMKASPMSAETAATGLLIKAASTIGVGVLGAAIMAAFDPPQSRKELFLHATLAGVGSFVFGPLALMAATKFVTFATPGELLMPVYFLVGALSWGAFGAIAKLRKLISDKGASALADRVGLK